MRLQWGRGSEAAECDQDDEQRIEHDVASMGPRLGGRGMALALCESRLGEPRFNGAAARRPRNAPRMANPLRLGRPASMGPRLGGRGMTVARFDAVAIT